jgi:hypothetical protein
MVFSPDLSALAIGCWDGSVFILNNQPDIKSRELMPISVKSTDNSVDRQPAFLAWSPNSAFLAIVESKDSKSYICLRSVTSGRVYHQFQSHEFVGCLLTGFAGASSYFACYSEATKLVKMVWPFYAHLSLQQWLDLPLISNAVATIHAAFPPAEAIDDIANEFSPTQFICNWNPGYGSLNEFKNEVHLCLPFLPSNFFSAPASCGQFGCSRIAVGSPGIIIIVDVLLFIFERTVGLWRLVELDYKLTSGSVAWCEESVILLLHKSIYVLNSRFERIYELITTIDDTFPHIIMNGLPLDKVALNWFIIQRIDGGIKIHHILIGLGPDLSEEYFDYEQEGLHVGAGHQYCSVVSLSLEQVALHFSTLPTLLVSKARWRSNSNASLEGVKPIFLLLLTRLCEVSSSSLLGHAEFDHIFGHSLFELS